MQVSEHAASMGGSQVFLEPGETQTAAELTKCIAIASANDAAVAMAEFVAGSEEAFVERMNRQRNWGCRKRILSMPADWMWTDTKPVRTILR